MTAIAYFRYLIREQHRRRAQEKFEAFLSEGMQSGSGIPTTPNFWKSPESELVDGTKAE